jgi:hypothetical protein
MASEERRRSALVAVGLEFGIVFFVFLPNLGEQFTAQGNSFPVHKKRYIFLAHSPFHDFR